MRLSKYNAEGYYDPTAYEGIRLAYVEKRKFKITYPTGYMELNLDCFFPCTLYKARRIFSLIHKYSSEKDKDRLLTFLRWLNYGYSLEIQEYADKARYHPVASKEYRETISGYMEARRLRQLTTRNIELFIAGRDTR